jgi:hypothetical protein
MAEEIHKIMTEKEKLSADDQGTLLFISAIIFGAWFRLYPPWAAGFPINDGGLFHEMIIAIQHDNYRLPTYIFYNGLEIPFAYPPLALYLTAAASDLFHLPVLELIRWLPGIILILVLPAIFQTALLILGSRFQAGLATLLYALLPRSVTWLIMGGGVTRAPGQLFLLLAGLNILLLFLTTKRRYLALSILFSSLVCLTHPEAAIHTIGLALLLCFFYGRNRAGISNAVMVAIGTLIVTAPWWVTVFLRFGIDPFLSAMGTGLHSVSYFIVLFVPWSGEPFLTIIAILAVIGFATQIARREYFLPAWVVLPFLLEPRSAANVSILPMALLSAIALGNLIFPALLDHENPSATSSGARPLMGRSAKFVFYYLTLCLLIAMQYFELDVSENRVASASRQTFQWIKDNTLPGSKFVIVTGQTDLFADFTNEWFPVLTDQISVTTIQGYEWIGRGRFAGQAEVIQKIQQCRGHTSPLTCIEDLVHTARLAYDYIYVARTVPTAGTAEKLIGELRDNSQYSIIHQTEDAVIFRHLP